MASILGWLVAAAVSVGAAVLFIPKELWKRWRERIVDRLDLMLRRRVSRFNRRYRDFMLGSLRFIDLKGLATVGFFTPELDDVFVDVSLAYRAPHLVPDSVLAQLPADVTDRHALAEFLDRPQPMVLAVIGVPGSGKTTLLRHTARRVCLQRRDQRRAVPILLYVRDHAGVIVSDPQVELPNLLRGTLGAHGQSEPPGWFEERLRGGDCVILLDGLDEVARQKDRRAVADWVERQVAQHPKNDFVITSRPQGYRTAPITGAKVLQVQGFTGEQVKRFVHGWYLAAERHATGVSDEDVQRLATTAADDLLSRLANAPTLTDLTVNPLLLTMIANVHRYRGALPGSRVDLYAEICQVMLWRRQEAKRLQSELSGDRKEALLRRLAFQMMQAELRDVSREDLLAELKPALKRISTTMTAEDFLADVSSNGLLVDREAGQYSFAHLTFQEYLAAMHIRDKGSVDLLAGSVDDPWWRETTLLYTARADADPIVKACLDSGSVTALALAFDVAYTGDLAPELRSRLLALLDSTDGDPIGRRLIAGVLATRHLRHNVIGRVCVQPVTTEIYDLFMTDTGTPAPDGFRTKPDQPVTGIRASDAVAFVHWVNKVTGGEPTYRLPTRAETDNPAVQRTLPAIPALSVWFHPDAKSGTPELWTPAGSGHPNNIDSETLTHHVTLDFTRATSTIAVLLALRGSSFDIAVDRTTERTNALARDHILALAAALAIDLDHARDLARDLARASDLALTAALAIDLDHVRGLADEFRIRPGVIGNALSSALRKAHHKKRNGAQRWLTELTDVFVDENLTFGVEYTVSLDMLTENVNTAEERLRKALRPATTLWTRAVAKRLKENALPIVSRQKAITDEIATAVRIAALCLATEADINSAGEVGDAYREIAAGITLLERRAKGLSPATEAIVLAI